MKNTKIIYRINNNNIIMEIKQYYSELDPNIDELVLVKFIKRNESFFEAKLLEYDYSGMLNYQDATKKRKVSSWNKLIPLNRNMVAKVIEIDNKSKIVNLSLLYLDDKESESMTPDELQEKLNLYFNENQVMENFIKSYCISNKIDLNELWIKLIHNLDIDRRNFNNDNDENYSLWKYFSENIDNINKYIDEEIAINLKNLYEKKTLENKKVISRIGIISSENINQTKNLLKQVFENIDFEYSFKYDSTPYYYFETFTKNISIEKHIEIVKNIETIAKTFNPIVYIKIDYLAKEL